ncbi:hypothetical protein GCM10022246_21870 [Pedobacter ginsengiterrae]|uniref:Uncharacterized protein n=1 Tax=Pedobacter ginsengiterrae TaxID=871696 RepID=A0ABP7PNN0_9SPHI
MKFSFTRSETSFSSNPDLKFALLLTGGFTITGGKITNNTGLCVLADEDNAEANDLEDFSS